MTLLLFLDSVFIVVFHSWLVFTSRGSLHLPPPPSLTPIPLVEQQMGGGVLFVVCLLS